MRKVFRIKEKEIFTTICILDSESSVLASATRIPTETDMKTTIYLLSRKLFQRSSLSLKATSKLTACKLFSIVKLAMNPVHCFKYVTVKQVDFLLAVYYYEFIALIAVDRGVSLRLIQQVSRSENELSSLMRVSKKQPDYLLTGTSTLKLYTINVSE